MFRKISEWLGAQRAPDYKRRLLEHKERTGQTLTVTTSSPFDDMNIRPMTEEEAERFYVQVDKVIIDGELLLRTAGH